MAKKATRKTLRAILSGLADMAEKDPTDAQVICDRLNEVLDCLLDEDFFGTEGQLDPRGDHRDG